MAPKGTHADTLSEAEKAIVWDRFETFWFTQSRGHIHLYPRCDYLDDPTEKPAAAFPPGFKPVCSWCVTEWRRMRE